MYNFIRVCVCVCVCLSVCVSLHGLPPNFTRALKTCLGRFLSPFRSSRLMGSGGNSASSRFNWCKVWNDVKCHFSSAHHHNQYVVGKLSISLVLMWNFTQIGHKTKKLRLSINPAWRQWPGTPTKGMNYHFSSPEFDERDVVGKLSILEA